MRWRPHWPTTSSFISPDAGIYRQHVKVYLDANLLRKLVTADLAEAV